MSLNRLAELRARRALAGARLDPELVLRPVESVTNEVWTAGDMVIRVNRRIHSRLSREAELVSSLPPGVLYPPLVAFGEGGSADWVVLKKVEGLPLVRCWPGLRVEERRRAVNELAVALQTLHATRIPEDLTDSDGPTQLLGFGARATEPLLEELDRASSLPNVDAGLLAEAAAFVRARRAALDPFESDTLIHGDLHFQNILWDGEQVTALLDFEFARAAPPDLDLDVFLRFCCFPFLFVPVGREGEALPEAYEDVPYWLRDAYPALFGHPRMFDRLRIYAIAFDLKDLRSNPPQVSIANLTPHHPYRRLVDTIHKKSHLDRLARG